MAVCYQADADPDTALSMIDRQCLAICETSTSSDVATMNDAVDALEERENNPLSVHATGLADLDRLLSGGDASVCSVGEMAAFQKE